MKYLFNNVSKFFSQIFAFIKEFFRNFALFFNDVLKDKKRLSINALLAFSSCLMMVSSSLLMCAFLPNNKAVVLSEIAREYKSDTGESPYGIVYPHQLVTQSLQTTYIMPQESAKMRNIFYENTFFDVYQADWGGLSTPGIVDYLDKEDVHVSFLCWPKDSYVHGKWLYEMPLVFPSSFSTTPSSNEIFINKSYADFLISTGEYSNYGEIVSMETPICIPYEWGYTSGSSVIKKTVSMFYFVKGIIDTESHEYKKYSEIFGDFFITNEALSLPILNQTFFEISTDDFQLRKQLDVLLETYDYTAKRANFSSLSSSMVFEYRITFFGGYDSDLSIRNIITNPTEWNVATDEMFQIFADKINIMYITIYIFANVISILSTLFLTGKLFREKAFNCFKSISNKQTFYVFVVFGYIVAIVFGILLTKLFSLFFPALNVLSYKNHIGFVFMVIEILLIFVFGFLKPFKSNISQNDESNNIAIRKQKRARAGR